MEKAHAALAAEGIALASNQVRINLLDRSIERNGLLAAAKRLGIGLIAYSPLAQGVLTGRFHDDPAQASAVSGMRRSYSKLGNTALERSAPVVRELKAIAAAHGATPAMTALAWILAFYGPILFAIPGATKPAQAEQNAGAMGLSLSAKELSALDEASRKSAATSYRQGKE
jgi:aryl-alcohol dehydrogenase-like predicted oxidoreductase